MSLSMRAIKTFTGRKGESRRADSLVQGGDDFNAENQNRADYLEGRGLAVPLIAPRAKKEPAPQNKMEPQVQNKAAGAGPLSSTGGKTGGTSEPASSSDQAPAPRRRVSRKPEGDLDL